MRDLDARDKVRQWGIWALIAGPLGAGIAAYSGLRLAGMDAPWASGDALWLGLFIGVLFIGMSGMALWNWLFARALTPEEERLREMMHDWQRERGRFTGGGD